MGRRYDIDWEAIQRDYRLGQFSVRQIAKQHAVSASAISRKAANKGWTKDLSAEVRARTRAGLLSKTTQNNTHSRDAETISADAAVDEAVRTNIELVRQHQSSLGRAHRVTAKMLTQLEAAVDGADKIIDAIHTDSDLDAKERKAMLKAADLPAKAQTAQALSATLRNLIPLERQAFNLNEPGNDGVTNPLTELHRQISGNSFRPVEK